MTADYRFWPKVRVGDRVRGYRPAWRDAAGREYAARRHHGEVGTVSGITKYAQGSDKNDRLVVVYLDAYEALYTFWESELRVMSEE